MNDFFSFFYFTCIKMMDSCLRRCVYPCVAICALVASLYFLFASTPESYMWIAALGSFCVSTAASILVLHEFYQTCWGVSLPESSMVARETNVEPPLVVR